MNLMKELESSRSAWKGEVVRRSREYRAETEKHINDLENFVDEAKQDSAHRKLTYRVTKLRRDNDLLDRICTKISEGTWDDEDSLSEPPPEPKAEDL